MTKEITKAIILQEIQNKFKLRELSPEIFRFSEEVIPVYGVEPHLGKWSLIEKTLNITSAIGRYFFGVPDNEQWTLRGYTLIFLGAANAIKVAGVYITRGDSDVFTYLDLEKNQAVSYRVNLPVPVTLHDPDAVWVNVDEYTSTVDLQLILDVKVEVLK